MPILLPDVLHLKRIALPLLFRGEKDLLIFNTVEAISHKIPSDDGHGSIQVKQKCFVFLVYLGTGHDSEEFNSLLSEEKHPLCFCAFHKLKNKSKLWKEVLTPLKSLKCKCDDSPGRERRQKTLTSLSF